MEILNTAKLDSFVEQRFDCCNFSLLSCLGFRSGLLSGQIYYHVNGIPNGQYALRLLYPLLCKDTETGM
jgi:hypothetical protein